MDPFKVKDPRPGIASASTAKKMSKPEGKTPSQPKTATAAAATKERKTSDVRRKSMQKAGREAVRGNFSKKKPRKKYMKKGG
jgi:hypothetical protein